MKKFKNNLRNVATIVACLAVTVMFTFTGCKKESKKEDDKAIKIANVKDLEQTAWADEETTGSGFTFTSKSDWSARVKSNTKSKDSDVPWIKLLCNGEETYEGGAGTFTIVISIEQNTTGEKRIAFIEIMCGNDKIVITVIQEGTTQGGGGEPVELFSPITENITLKNLGLPVDYFFTGSLLIVENNATLTIEPGVTIQFSKSNKSGSLEIKSGATIKAIGTESKRIKFIGMNNEKGSWGQVNIITNTDNQFAYCDFVNIGSNPRSDYSGITLYNGKVGLSHCKLSGGLGGGLYISGNSEISVFNNNVFENFDLPPVESNQDNCLKVLEKFDMTSNFVNNKYPYISVPNPWIEENVTLSQTTVPYYFDGNTLNLKKNLTINAGVTIYMGSSQSIEAKAGRLMIKGTADKKVKITRYPEGSNYYWGYISFRSGGQGSEIEHCILEYGGRTGTNDGILLINDDTDLTLKNVAINNSQHYGVLISYCDFTVHRTNVTFYNNKDGNVYHCCGVPCGGYPDFP